MFLHPHENHEHAVHFRGNPHALDELAERRNLFSRCSESLYDFLLLLLPFLYMLSDFSAGDGSKPFMRQSFTIFPSPYTFRRTLLRVSHAGEWRNPRLSFHIALSAQSFFNLGTLRIRWGGCRIFFAFIIYYNYALSPASEGGRMRPESNKLAEPPRRIVSFLHGLYEADTLLLWFFATCITGTALDFFQSSSRGRAQVVSLPFSRSCSAAVNRTRSNSHTENLFDRRPHCEFPFPDRVAWEEKIKRMETRNREAVERLLRAA